MICKTKQFNAKVIMTNAETDKKPLSDAARRALDEARSRREREAAPDLPPEIDGRDGPEPTRFGDWEKDGITSDF